MSDRRTLSRTVARRLLAHAVSVLPAGHSGWAKAMRNELDYIQQDVVACRWAIGCLSACYIARIKTMEVREMKTVSISRVVLSLEMLLCFVVPTGTVLSGFITIIFSESLQFWSTPMSALLLTTGLVGPLGLFLAFKSIVLETRQMSKRMTFVFSALAGWTFVGNTFFVLSVASPGYELRAIILMALLPAVGAAHLVYLANAERNELAPA